MKYYCLFIFICIISCKQKEGLQSREGNETTTFISNDTIPEIRTEVSRKPVASYWVPIGNPLLKFKFGVDIFETPQTFNYLLRMQYEGMVVTDTLKLPNFGVWPTVQVQKGKDKTSCIIGFLDKKKEFKPYKLLTVQNDQLKLKVLKRYFVGVYRDAHDTY